MARPAMDVCVVLARERCYMVSVDEALSEENERAVLGPLNPCLAELDQQVLLLDGEEVAHEDGLDIDDDLARRGFQPVADVIDVGLVPEGGELLQFINPIEAPVNLPLRSEERRVGKECRL